MSAKKVSEAGLKMVIEVEAGYWADTGVRTAEMVRTIDNAALAINWDPGNAFEAGEIPFPDGYDAVRKYVQHVHFKDLEFNASGDGNYVIDGQIDWQGQIEALANDGYKGHISVEPHMQPKVQSAKAMTDRLRNLIGSVLNQA